MALIVCGRPLGPHNLRLDSNRECIMYSDGPCRWLFIAALSYRRTRLETRI